MSKRKVLERGEISPNCLPEVLALIDRAERASVSMLYVCRKAGVHHGVFARWRRAEAAPTITTLNKLKDTLTELEAENATQAA
jgi:hypothetical protein